MSKAILALFTFSRFFQPWHIGRSRFQNTLNSSIDWGFWRVLKMHFGGELAKWPDWVDLPIAPNPLERVTGP